MVVTFDFETRSEADLTKTGPWAYAEHPSTEVVCACWAVDDGPVRRWWPSWLLPEAPEADPEEVAEAVLGGGHLIEAHNAAFEFSVWHAVCVERMGWRPIPPGLWRDSMATACYYALPAPLEKLCRALGMPGKDPDGERLISRYSKLHNKSAVRIIPHEDGRKFVSYCATDVEREREVGTTLGDLPPEEERVFVHDFTVGARGIYLDLTGIEHAQDVVDARTRALEARFRELTGVNVTQRDAVLAWLRREGHDLPDLQAGTLEVRLKVTEEDLAPWNDDLERPVALPTGVAKEAMELRLAHSKASTKKLDAMARQRGRDGCARFQTRFHGASTGRNTGTGFQPLNLTRGWEWSDPPDLVRDISYGSPEWLDAVYGDAMSAVSAASRHWIKARGGNRLVVGDYSSIEAVVLPVGAGQLDRVEEFREKKPIYELAACRIYGWPEERAYDPDFKHRWPNERQDGKVQTLACGYQGALGAWRKFDRTDRHSDEAVIEYVRGWRRDNSRIVDFWRELNWAAMRATACPGEVVVARACEDGLEVPFERVDGWLTMMLPDGKRIWYWAPRIVKRMPRWHQPGEKEDCAAGRCDCEPEARLSYMAWKMGQWLSVDTYGGKLAENWTQATCRQLLKPAEARVEAAGYPVILSVYDEVVADVPVGHGSVEEFGQLLLPVEDWAAGWPVRAECWEGERYRK